MRGQQIHAYDSAESAGGVVANVLLGKPDNVSPEAREGLVQDAVSGAAGARGAWPAYGMGEEYERWFVEEVTERVRAGTCPRFLVVAGELDRVETPEAVEAKVVDVIKKAGAEVQSSVLPGIGHLSPVEAPEGLAEAIGEFVDSLSS